MFKPEGYNCLSPYLIVDDTQATVDFIKAVFDVEPDVPPSGPSIIMRAQGVDSRSALPAGAAVRRS